VVSCKKSTGGTGSFPVHGRVILLIYPLIIIFSYIYFQPEEHFGLSPMIIGGVWCDSIDTQPANPPGEPVI